MNLIPSHRSTGQPCGICPLGVISATGVSAPLTLIMVTVAMLSITSIMATASLVSLGSFAGDGSLNAASNVVELHESLEEIFAAPPGTSITLFMDIPSGTVEVTDHGIQSGGPIPRGLIDYAGIVVSETSTEISYNSSLLQLTPVTLGPGLSKIVITAKVSGGLKVISLEVGGG